MKILQIAPCYVDINNETGGVANVIRQISLRLDKEKIPTILICSNTELGKIVTEPKTVIYSEFLTIYAIEQYKNPLLGPVGKLKKIFESIGQVSLVHVHTCFSALTDFSLKHYVNNGIPCVFTPHGKLSPTMFGNKKIFKEAYFKLFIKEYLNRVNTIIVGSSNEKAFAKALGLKGNFSHIYNGFNEPLDSLINDELPFGLRSKSYILFLGYLDARKQPDLLVRAFKQSGVAKNMKLVLAGPDSYGFQATIERLVVSLGLEIGKDVIFTGRVSGYEKWNLLRNSKALCLPSKGEGWPVVIAEAIGAKIPCIISQGCNFGEIENMKLGLEVKSFDINDWVQAIDEVCLNKNLCLEFAESIELWRGRFTWTNITSQWISSYKVIVDEAAAR